MKRTLVLISCPWLPWDSENTAWVGPLWAWICAKCFCRDKLILMLPLILPLTFSWAAERLPHPQGLGTSLPGAGRHTFQGGPPRQSRALSRQKARSFALTVGQVCLAQLKAWAKWYFWRITGLLPSSTNRNPDDRDRRGQSYVAWKMAEVLW